MGKIYQRGKSWYSDYSFQGKRIRRPLSPNRRDAQTIQNELVSANRFRKHGLLPEKFRWDAFKIQYLRIRKEERRPNTYAHDDIAFRRLDELFAIIYISEITPELLENAKIKWKERGYGPSAIGSYVMRIKVAMKTAEDWRYISIQPWRIVKDYVSPGKLIYYTMEQFQKCLAQTSGFWRTGLLLMARAGLRSGEVIHLEWEDINFKEKTIYIHPKSFWKPKGWKPSNPHARYIDMPEDLEAYLGALPHKQEFVLGHKRVGEGTYSRYYSSLLLKVGLRGSAHAFRHTYASWLISNGCSLEEVGILLGHTNPVTTRMYAHLMPHARRRAVERLPELVTELCLSFPPESNLSGMKKNRIIVLEGAKKGASTMK
jgi:integrase